MASDVSRYMNFDKIAGFSDVADFGNGLILTAG
jgi:hypothetical protein